MRLAGSVESRVGSFVEDDAQEVWRRALTLSLRALHQQWSRLHRVRVTPVSDEWLTEHVRATAKRRDIGTI
jgi:hypothetical protein